jgi:hypothetical protein
LKYTNKHIKGTVNYQTKIEIPQTPLNAIKNEKSKNTKEKLKEKLEETSETTECNQK